MILSTNYSNYTVPPSNQPSTKKINKLFYLCLDNLSTLYASQIKTSTKFYSFLSNLLFLFVNICRSLVALILSMLITKILCKNQEHNVEEVSARINSTNLSSSHARVHLQLQLEKTSSPRAQLQLLSFFLHEDK